MLKFLFLFLIAPISNAQNKDILFEIFYDYTLNSKSQPYIVNSLLKFNKYASIYEIDHTKIFTDPNSKKINNEELVLQITSKENIFVYKDFPKDEMFYTNTLEFKHFYIKDSLNIMNWTIQDKKKDVLGYSCTEAIAPYGGRLYVAYFTDEIPISNGPWRFNGLPGVILEIKSLDNYFEIVATSITIKNEEDLLTNPYKNKKLLNWDEFLKLYRKKYDEVLRNGMTPLGPSTSLPKKGIFEYIKD